MQINEETQLDQQVPDQGAAAVSTGAPASAAKKASRKKASKKKASKKKASKKKASKKKASKKKASKKKASKKKASKKKASRKVAVSEDMAKVLAAADALRDALYEMATHRMEQRRELMEDFRDAVSSTLGRLTGKG